MQLQLDYECHSDRPYEIDIFVCESYMPIQGRVATYKLINLD